MTIPWNRMSQVAVAVCFLGALPCTSASADPFRITIHFTVMGMQGFDPDFGDASANGFFSLVTEVPRGPGFHDVGDPRGLGADQLSLAFAGENWTAANADVRLLTFLNGQLVTWSLLADRKPDGFGFRDHPAFIASCAPNGCGFVYSTARSQSLEAIFNGRLSTTSVSIDPVASTPEPSTLLLCAAGMAALLRRKPLTVP